MEILLSPGYRLADEEDGSVYSDGGDLDQFIPRREWPDVPLPEAPVCRALLYEGLKILKQCCNLEWMLCANKK